MFNVKNLIIGIGTVLVMCRLWIGVTISPEPMLWVDVYKDLAHIFIGVLGTMWWYRRESWQWDLFWILNAVEVVVAIASRL